jgi:hypothetical protein
MFIYLGQTITIESIDVFHTITSSKRQHNDKNNKLRESIIAAIINNDVPSEYYDSPKWGELKTSVNDFLQRCATETTQTGSDGGSLYSHVKCIPAAGRTHSYDFSIQFTYGDENNNDMDCHPPPTTTIHKVEFKYNAKKVSDTPQFVSPMKPSQYLSSCYEEYFYDNYLTKIAIEVCVALPSRDEWLKQIHNTSPICVRHLQDKYYAGCRESSQFTNTADDIAFYKLCKKYACESIQTFIATADLDIEKLSEYLTESQRDKIYMLYTPGNGITLQRVNPSDYKIVSYTKNPKRSRYDCLTESGKKIKVLLRWKNGNGIAFPAFQIS